MLFSDETKMLYIFLKKVRKIPSAGTVSRQYRQRPRRRGSTDGVPAVAGAFPGAFAPGTQPKPDGASSPLR